MQEAIVYLTRFLDTSIDGFLQQVEMVCATRLTPPKIPLSRHRFGISIHANAIYPLFTHICGHSPGDQFLALDHL